MTDLLIIVPTRSRPEAVARVVEAWKRTGAFDDGAELLFNYDRDDLRAADYLKAFDAIGNSYIHRCRFRQSPEWRPLVPKLNRVAFGYARDGEHLAIGFAGDDHLPRSVGWVKRYLDKLRERSAGIVSCADGYRTDRLPTQWAMRADLIRGLGAMVPAPVEHLYCDDVIRDVGTAAGCYDYLPEVLIEHMHPVAGKADSDEQYDRVNSRQQYRGDRRAYREWRDGGGLQHAAAVATRIIRERS